MYVLWSFYKSENEQRKVRGNVLSKLWINTNFYQKCLQKYFLINFQKVSDLICRTNTLIIIYNYVRIWIHVLCLEATDMIHIHGVMSYVFFFFFFFFWNSVIVIEKSVLFLKNESIRLSWGRFISTILCVLFYMRITNFCATSTCFTHRVLKASPHILNSISSHPI